MATYKWNLVILNNQFNEIPTEFIHFFEEMQAWCKSSNISRVTMVESSG